MKPPTKRQLQVLSYIYWMRAFEYFVSIRTIGRHFGLRSTRAVKEHVAALQKKGLVAWMPGRTNTLYPTAEGYALIRAQPIRVERDALDGLREMAASPLTGM